MTSDPAAASTAITAMLDGLNAQGRSFPCPRTVTRSPGRGLEFRQRQAVAVLHRGPRGRRRDRVGSRGARARTRRRLTGPVHPHVGDARRGARESDGQPIMTQQVVTLVDVQAPADTAALARLLNPIVPTITAESLGADLGKSDGKPITAVACVNRTSSPFGTSSRPFPGWSSCSRPGCSRWTGVVVVAVLADLATVWQEQQQDESAGGPCSW